METMKIKAKEKDGIVKVKAQIKHEMMTYNAAKQKGVEANFIISIVGKIGERKVYELSSSQFISKNPIFKFQFLAQKGETLDLIWTDKSGQSVQESKIIK